MTAPLPLALLVRANVSSRSAHEEPGWLSRRTCTTKPAHVIHATFALTIAPSG
jgi:hypothetical protein